MTDPSYDPPDQRPAKPGWMWRTLEDARRTVATTAAWESLSLDQRERAMRLLLGKNWETKTRRIQDAYTSHLRRVTGI